MFYPHTTNAQRNFGNTLNACMKTKFLLTLYKWMESYSDSLYKADILNNYFSSDFTKDNQSSPPNISSEPVPFISQITVEVDGIYNLLTNLDPHKAAGPDGIPSKTA